MSTGILPSWWTPSELKAKQQALLADATQVNAAVSTCTSLDAATRTRWGSFYQQVQDWAHTTYGWFTTTNPDGSWSWGGGTGVVADTTEAFARTLYAWQLMLGKKCDLAMPTINPDVSPGTDAVTSVVKYAAIGAAFVASAYVVGRVVSVLPRREGVER